MVFMDSKTTIQELKDLMKGFCDEREWDYHNAKELAIDLNIEAGELLEQFRYLEGKEIDDAFKEKKDGICDELADVLMCVCRFAELYEIDLSDAYAKKIKESKAKYPVEKFKGLKKKYNELQ